MIFCSPVIDLHLFWSTSPNLSVREKGFDELFNYYYKILSNTLRELNYPAKRIPTKKELQQEFDDNAIYGTLTIEQYNCILFFLLNAYFRTDSFRYHFTFYIVKMGFRSNNRLFNKRWRRKFQRICI